MSRRFFVYLSAALLCTTANAEVQKISEGIYAGIGDNAVLLVLLTHAGQIIWSFGKWIVDKYFREQQDKDAEVKKLKQEFHAFREEIVRGFGEIKVRMEHMAKLPDEDKILHKLSERMEFMVFKAARDLGIKDNKR